MTVSPPPGAGAGASGDGLTEGGGMVAVSSADDVEVVVVVLSEPASSPLQPVASEPAATPAASANRAEFGITRRLVMSSGIARRHGS
jgi:hypothetical protein